MSKLNFISDENFTEHIKLTIKQYGNKLVSYDLKKFNSNTIDPIKLIFDKIVYGSSWDEIIKNEIFRQRNQSVNNDIGYFHQNIFKYIKNCNVPNLGWDVVFERNNNKIFLPDGDEVKTIYAELKNKHNTMNSSSSSKTYMKMQSQLLENDDCACFLVEAIAKKSQNIPWEISIDGIRKKHRRIRRVSIDQFYHLVTGQEDAFYQMCLSLPETIEQIVQESQELAVPKDIVFEQLQQLIGTKADSFMLALYLLGFNSYTGFKQHL